MPPSPLTMAQPPVRSKASDDELLARFATGRDQRAFAELVTRHGVMVQAVVRRMLRNVHDAEDAFQATFLALAKSASRVRWRSDVAGWLHQTAVRTAKTVRKMNGSWERGKQRQGTRPTHNSSSLSAVELEELRSAIDEELRGLPTKYSTAVVLCDIEGLSRVEAAARMGSPVTTLKNRLSVGRKRLREGLARRGFAFSVAALATYAKVAGEVRASTVNRLAESAVRYASTNTLNATAPPAAYLAEGVLHQMTVSKITSALSTTAIAVGLVVAAAASGWNTVRAELPFFDDFEDGSIADAAPATWTTSTIWPNLAPSVDAGRLVLAANGPGVILPDVGAVSEPDVVLEADLEFTDVGDHTAFAGIYGRLEADGRGGYIAALNSAGDLYLLREDQDGTQTVLATQASDLLVANNLISLRFGLEGPNLSFSAVDLSTGVEASVAATDGAFAAAGSYGLFINPSAQGLAGEATAEFEHFLATPEPSSSLLAAMGCLVGTWIWWKRRDDR